VRFIPTGINVFCLNGFWCFLSRNYWFVSAGSLFVFLLQSLIFAVCVSVGPWCVYFCGNHCFCLGGF